MEPLFPSLIEEKVAAQAETAAEREKRIRQELISCGQKFEGVKFKFVEPKLKISPDKLPREVNWQLFPADLSAEDKERISSMFNKFIDFLGADIITDDFEYHDDRGNWERKYRDQLSPEVWDLYKNNRLGLTNASRPKGLFDYFSEFKKEYNEKGLSFIDPKLLSRLEGLVSIMPEELKSGDLYGQIGLDKKIEASNKVAPIFSAIVQTFGLKPVDKKN